MHKFIPLQYFEHFASFVNNSNEGKYNCNLLILMLFIYMINDNELVYFKCEDKIGRSGFYNRCLFNLQVKKLKQWTCSKVKFRTQSKVPSMTENFQANWVTEERPEEPFLSTEFLTDDANKPPLISENGPRLFDWFIWCYEWIFQKARWKNHCG